MFKRIADWLHLRGHKQHRIRLSAARAATREMAKRHRRDRDSLYAEMRRIQEAMREREKLLQARERALEARIDALRVEQEEFIEVVAVIRGAFSEWVYIVNFFRHNTGKLFAAFDKMEHVLDRVRGYGASETKSRKRGKTVVGLIRDDNG